MSNLTGTSHTFGLVSTSDKIAAMAAIFSLMAILATTFVYALSSRSSERNLRLTTTFNIWSAWISRDYRRYRVDAYHAIRRAKKDCDPGVIPTMSQLLSDQSSDEAIGSIEHFIFETSKLMEMGLIDKKTFSALFGRSMRDWKGLLEGFDRGDGRDSFTDAELSYSFSVLLGEV